MGQAGNAREMVEVATSVPLWRDRAFRLIWAGQTGSIFGDRVTGFALPWLVLAQTHSPFAAGLVTGGYFLPPLVLGLVAGGVADRLPRRRVLIACDLGRALALCTVVACGLLALAPPLWLLVGVVLVLGTGQLGFQVAYRAWLPSIMGESRLMGASAALEASDAVSTLTGPPLAGVLVQAIGPALALGADACSYCFSALTLSRLPADESPAPVADEQSRRGAWILAGVRHILTTPAQRILKGCGTVLFLSAGSIELLLATLTQLRLGVPAWQAGLIYGAAGIGGLGGSAIISRLSADRWRRGLACTLAIAALGAGGLAWASVMGPHGGFIVALLSNLILDGAVSAGFILTTTANALTTPPLLRGRVNAAGTMYSSAVRMVGALALGALASRGNPLPTFVVLGGCFVATAIIAALARDERNGKLGEPATL
ncbi:MAG TPA: MFS transporter [Ktedonobacterales bacterium]